jgi:uncharacterized protein (UPF0147 family)
MYDLDTSDLPEFNQDSGDSGIDTQTSDQAPVEPQTQNYKYTANGKEIEEDLDTILQRASQGYNYAQHMQELKAKQDEIAQQESTINSLREKWEQYDKYANENPEWAEFVRGQWENRNKQQADDKSGDSSAVPESVRAELAELKKFKEEIQHNFQKQREAEEDAILQQQFDEISKKYPDYDLKHTDPRTGMSLEMQVLEHARVNGIHSVKAAFRDMMHDDLVAKAITKAKEDAAKELAKRTQKGFVAESDNSMLSKYSSPAKKSHGYYDDIMSSAQELGIL